MSAIRLGLYAAVVVVVGVVAWIATGPGPDATPAEVISTAAPASTLPAGTPRTSPPTAGTVLITSVPAPDQTVVGDSSTTVPAPAATIVDGDEGSYDGTEPESVAVDFVVTAFAECWSCDPEARQRRLAKLAVPQVVAEWPPMSMEERSVFTVRTVTIDDVTIKDDTTIAVAASVTTETDINPTSTTSITIEVDVVDGVVVAASSPAAPVEDPETAA